MRTFMERSQTITDDVVSILGSFDHHLSALETAMQVTHSTQNRCFLDWVYQFLQDLKRHNPKLHVILQAISIQGLISSSGGGSTAGGDRGSSGASRAVVKDRFKTFNTMFEELHQKQSQRSHP
ncbi:hypothetical protein VNO80_02319 [Phaseolus coccineus]|uniref:Exocyst complex subunit Exo70 C-terminal domain-containing protein n=1 Tax=Phaseolus coccineus TaxID=3886 RepID=A0AAN9NR38_PHACN